MLVNEPLHPRGAAMASTLQGIEGQPSKRAPDRTIAPELDAACAAALVEAPGDRPTARALADAVQRYLDGDRDFEARRTLAEQHLVEAREALTAGDRVDAMRFAGRALALRPESREAAELVTQLMIEPPDPAPPVLRKRLDENDLTDVARQGRYAALALAGYLAFVPILVAIGVRDWTVVGAAVGLILAMMAGAIVVAPDPEHHVHRVPERAAPRTVRPHLLTDDPRPDARRRAVAALSSGSRRLNTPLVFSLMIAGVLVPVLLEVTGLVPRTTTFAADGITVRPDALAFGATSTPVMLCAAHVATIIVVGLVVRSLASSHRAARRKLEEQTWMLEQLLPSTAGSKTRPA